MMWYVQQQWVKTWLQQELNEFYLRIAQITTTPITNNAITATAIIRYNVHLSDFGGISQFSPVQSTYQCELATQSDVAVIRRDTMWCVARLSYVFVYRTTCGLTTSHELDRYICSKRDMKLLTCLIQQH